MSDEKKSWVCPCNGCKKARKQVFQELQDIIDKWSPDVHLTYHELWLKIHEELNPTKKEKKGTA